jgi:2-methylcitrate dehydratase PrpD
MTAIEQLGDFVATYVPDDGARAVVRLHAADTIGAWIAACGTAEGRALLAYRRADAVMSDRVAINCALARLSEIDDIHLGAMITPGAIVVPAALTISASMPSTKGVDLAAAIIAGYEAMIRLGVAIDGPTVLYRGIWPSYFAAPFGVAAAVARLMRLDRQQTAHALATALIMAAPGAGHHAAATTARWLAIGYAASRGLQAAQTAWAGFTSDLNLANGDFLKGIYGVALNPGVLGGGLGELALRQVSFKPWCAARQTMAATQALKEVLAGGVPVDSITGIDIAVLPPHQKMIDHGVTVGDRFSHLTSVQYQMAVAALTPDAAYKLHPPAGPTPAAISAFMALIKVRGEESLLVAGYPQNWVAQIVVTTASRQYQRTVTYVPGDPARPFGEADLKAKFGRVVAPLLDGNEADRVNERALAALDQPAEMLAEIERISARVRA